MKKIYVYAAVISCITLFAYCSGSKNATTPKEVAPTFTYTGHVQSLVTEKCSPCHIAGKGNKLSLDNMDAMKTNIDDIIRRIELN
ncbi:MAG: hypothetical protein EOP47_28330, partial [Sphingobacteriaceae bacterium]